MRGFKRPTIALQGCVSYRGSFEDSHVLGSVFSRLLTRPSGFNLIHVDDPVHYIELRLQCDTLGEDGGLGDVEVKSIILLEDVL
jgi:hypothetical protein